MRRAVILSSSAGVCAVAAVLFLWSVAPRGSGSDAHGDGDAQTMAFANTPLSAPVAVPMPTDTTPAPAATATPDRPQEDTAASSNTATERPTVEVAIVATTAAPAPAPAPSPAPAVAAAPAKAVQVADSSGDVTVGQKNREFTVKEARVKAGGTVKFVNDDTVAHNVIVTMPGGKLRNTGVQEPGQSASMQFSDPGKYDVECAIHPQMKMTVNVQ